MNKDFKSVNEISSHPKVLNVNLLEGTLYITVEDPFNPPFLVSISESSEFSNVVFIGKING